MCGYVRVQAFQKSCETHPEQQTLRLQALFCHQTTGWQINHLVLLQNGFVDSAAQRRCERGLRDVLHERLELVKGEGAQVLRQAMRNHDDEAVLTMELLSYICI